MAQHQAMVDIETLDTKGTAVVFQIGFVIFDEGGIIRSSMYHVDVMDQIMAGRTIDKETVDWWSKQKQESWANRYHEGVHIYSLAEALGHISGQFQNQNYNIEKVWSNSPSFDAVILRSAARSLGIPESAFPWDFRKDIDLRTARQLLIKAGFKPPELERPTTHDAVEDCIDQIVQAQWVLKTLGLHEAITG